MRKSVYTLLFLLALLPFSILESCSEDRDFLPIPTTEQFKASLSEYNVYQGDPADLQPAEDFHLFEMSSTLFANYAEKQRLVKLPEGTRMQRDGDGVPLFPNGSILVKTFFYFQDQRDESLGKRIIETRLLVKKEDLWNVASYVWNDSQTEATLDLNGFDTSVNWIDLEGATRSIPYHVPDENECVSCHQLNTTVSPIGPSLRNMNFNVERASGSLNQLEHLYELGLIDPLDATQIGDIPNYYDESESLERRARAYLDMNCAHCHNPNGWRRPARQGLDFRYETALEETGILDEADRIERLTREGEMPFLGITVIDQDGVDLIRDYINSL